MTVTVGKPKLVFFSERFNGPPFVDCLEAAFASVAAWMGYEDDPTFVRDLRTASGRPLYDDGTPDGSSGGKPQGTSWSDLQKAVSALLPGASVTFGTISQADLFDALPHYSHKAPHKAVFAVIVPDTGKLPAHYQRLVGESYDGAHAFAIVGVRFTNDFGSPTPPALKIFDPMGRTTKPKNAPATWQPYDGEWIAASAFLPAVQLGQDSNFKVAYGYKGAALAPSTGGTNA